jgi:D,D-heptose 1,7-bisphosphate phosphatase
LRKAAFLDRDGVINKDTGYVHRWEDFAFLPGAIDGMKKLKQAGYVLIIVTNQSGIARGYFSEAQYLALTETLLHALAIEGVLVDAVYHCPHHPMGRIPQLSVTCDCRKPAPGMLIRAAQERGLSLSDSILVGDKPSDIAAGRAAEIGRAYLLIDDAATSPDLLEEGDGSFFSLLDCANHLCPG